MIETVLQNQNLLTKEFKTSSDQSDYKERMKLNNSVVESLELDSEKLPPLRPKKVFKKFRNERKNTFPPDFKDFPELSEEVV